MLKGKYVTIFTVMFLLVVYQVLLSFNIVPYVLTGEDLFLVLSPGYSLPRHP